VGGLSFALQQNRPERKEALIDDSLVRSRAQADPDLSALTESVRNLGRMANEMNGELRTQNRMLAEIEGDIDSVQDRFKLQNRQLRRLA
jgi:hypothetical protein